MSLYHLLCVPTTTLILFKVHKTAQQYKETGGATTRRNSELICEMNGEGAQEDFCHPKMYIIAFMLVHM